MMNYRIKVIPIPLMASADNIERTIQKELENIGIVKEIHFSVSDGRAYIVYRRTNDIPGL